jgi:hypothetical protein
VNSLYDWQPIDEDTLDALRHEAPPPPPYIRAGFGWVPDTTSGRIAALGLLRQALWQALQAKAR